MGRHTELDVDEALLSGELWENFGINLHRVARISWQEGQKQASGLCAWRERVESGRDLGEVSGDHFGKLGD